MRVNQIRQIRLIAYCGVVLALIMSQWASAQILNETCSVTVNGRTAQVRADGSFSIAGVPVAVDLFRVTGVCQGTGVPLYVVGDEFFQMATNGQTIGAGVTLDSIAPPKVASISVSAGVSTLTMPGQTTQLQVNAHYANGMMEDVTPRAEGTAYRTSNPAIATVSVEGLVTAVANGTALLTVSNQGATAVLPMAVSLGDPLTTVEGFVQLEDGTPVNGAMVTTTLGGSAMSGPNGEFTINGIASLQGSIVVEAEAMVGMTTLYGQSLELEPIKEAITDAGIVEIGNKVYWITNGSGNWSMGSNWHTGAPPTSGQIAVIDRPGMNIVVTHSAGTTTPAGIICEETIQLTGGTLAPSGYSEIATLNINSGTLSGAGEVVVKNGLNWTGGTMTDVGTTTVDFGAKMSISGSAAKTLTSNRILRNEGEITWTGSGTLFMNVGASVVNVFGAVWDIQNNSNVTLSSLPIATISNAGTIRKTIGTGVTTIGTNVTLNNTGTLTSQTGTISLQGGGTNMGVFSCASGTSIDIDAGTYNFATGGDTNGPGFVRVSGGTLSVGAGLTANADRLGFSSGTMSGTGNLIIRGEFEWSGGTMTGAGVITVSSTGVFDINGAAAKTMSSNRQLVNNGSGTWTGSGTWFMNSGAAFMNGLVGVFDFQNNANYTLSSLPVATIANAGTIRKTVGGGSSTVGTNILFDNTGTLESQAGIVSLQGGGTSFGLFKCSAGASIDIDTGTYNFGTGADTNGPGFVRVSGGTLSVGMGINANADKLALTSGSMTGAGNLDVRGEFEWSGGTVTGAGTTTVTSAGTLDVNGSAAKTMSSNRQLVNNGSGTWTGTGTWFMNTGAVFTNGATGVFDFQNNANYTLSVLPVASISNAGTIRKTVATGTSTVGSNIAFNNTGTLDSQSGIISLQGGGTNTGLFSCSSGASVDIDASTYNFGTGADTSGPGFVRVSGGTLSVSLGLTANADKLALSSGTIGGTGSLVVDGEFNWSGGTMTAAGTTTVSNSGTLNVNGTAAKTLSGSRQLINHGTGAWTGTGTWFMNSSSSFTNGATGVFEFQNSASYTLSTLPAATITNAGTIRKTTLAGTTNVGSNISLDNSGTLESQTGTISIQGGGTSTGLFACSSGATIQIDAGTYNFGMGADTNGPGFVQISGGTLSVGAGITAEADTFGITSGTLSGVGNLEVRGELNWAGGTMSGSGTTTVADTGELNMNGASSKTLSSSRHLVNNGMGTWTGTGTWFLNSSSQFTTGATGVFDIQNNASISLSTTPNAAISNQGMFLKSAGGSTTSIVSNVPFTNSGTLEVQSGTISFGSFTQTAGVTVLNGGSISSGATLNMNGGSVSGSGSVSANVSNAATFDPGFSPGTIAITGTYMQTAVGSFEVEIGGFTAGTDFDRVTSTGAASLNGTLNISLINGFEPMEGDTFVIMTFSSRTGNFSMVNGTDAGNGLEFQVNTGPTSVTLEVIQP